MTISRPRAYSPSPASRAFTITEILVVIGVIVVLSGFLLAALTAVRGTGKMAKSMNSLRQIGIWMQAYSSDNREFILPSQFDYSNNPYTGKVRSGTVTIGNELQGTWTDILWTIHDLGGAEDSSGSVSTYRYDSPDAEFYKRFVDFDSNPLRSSAENTRVTAGGTPGDLPTPFGPGAQEAGEPGYFAANDFFDARPDPSDPTVPVGGRWYTNGQIAAPDRSLYLVDSFAGETIADEPPPFDSDPALSPSPLQVDYRYNGLCLVLFLDGHVSPEATWRDLNELQTSRAIKVQDLDQR